MPPKKTIVKSPRKPTASLPRVAFILTVNFLCRCGMESPKVMGCYATKAAAEAALTQFREKCIRNNLGREDLSAEILQTLIGVPAEEDIKGNKSFFY